MQGDDAQRISVVQKTGKSADTTPEPDYRGRTRFPRSLKSLELTDVGMTDLGFEALIRWLQSLRSKLEPEGLEEEERINILHLGLHANEIQGTSQTAQALISALSFISPSGYPTSSLTSLILSSNPLSAEFKQTLFTLLPSLQNSLRCLQLSATGLTKIDAGHLASYVGRPDGSCKLIELRANANNMGHWGVKKVVDALCRCWTIEKVELFANFIDDEDEASDDADAVEDADEETTATVLHYIPSQDAVTSMAIGSGCGRLDLERKLKNTLARNIYLKRGVTDQSLKLLRYSRQLLWQNGPRNTKTSLGPQCATDCECSPVSQSTSKARKDSNTNNSHASFSFTLLPTEIQLSILSHVAPLLSTAQKLRIFEYASNKATLPMLRLCLPSSQSLPLRRRSNCIPDPTSLGFGLTSVGISNHGSRSGSLSRSNNLRSSHSTGCSGGSCMGSKSVKCQRETDRKKWLADMGCDVYDPGTANT
ncbi:hypothetical protein M413DRAFT_443190 [Hebeloma cylindrosporum]|uniref:Uncharacterized protein n=1 Tax=Hebeloma cylindrosporum TaxID=76867 RepID=A0A0C3CJ95_HEBCY|nr:hypothetical protein M413DRAFT_443190 [Hebeloma cylindrosporum h7]